MATTTRRALRYPVLADNPDVPRDIQNLANDIDSVLGSITQGTLAARPSSGQKDGDVYIARDDKTLSDLGTPYWWDSTSLLWRGWSQGSLATYQPVVPAASLILRSVKLSTDAQPMMTIRGDGLIQWGVGGSTAVDCSLFRVAAGVLRFQDGIDVLSPAVSSALTAVGFSASGDSQYRWQVRRDGWFAWGSGAATPDAFLGRSGAGQLAVNTSPVSGALLTLVGGGGGSNLEWGHANPAGFRCTLGAAASSGAPFIALSAEAGTTANTFLTRGIAGSIITTDGGGTMLLGGVALASANNQAFVKNLSLTTTTLGFFGATAVAKTTGYGSGSQVVAGTKGALTTTSTLNDVLTNLSSLIADLRILGLIGA